MWEEGYQIKELNKRSLVLLERKEELESRRKRMLALKRAVKKNNSNNLNHNMSNLNNTSSNLNNSSSNNLSILELNANSSSVFATNDEEVEVDMELTTESEVIKNHFEQLKRCVCYCWWCLASVLNLMMLLYC